MFHECKVMDPSTVVQAFTLLRQVFSSLSSLGFSYHVVFWTFSNFYEAHAASVFRIEGIGIKSRLECDETVWAVAALHGYRTKETAL
jgi:hypothetical protein